MEQIGKIIGRRKYDALKALGLDDPTEETLRAMELQFPNMSVADGLKMIEEYERETPTELSSEQKSKIIEYFDRIYEEQPQKEIPFLTKEILWKRFSKAYLSMEGRKYSDNNDSLENIKPLVHFFIGDMENFTECKRLPKKDGVFVSEPSFKKGFLIIGGYGNRKTSVMRAFEACLKRTNIAFRMYSANEVVDMYESCQNAFDKDEFWRMMKTGAICFDDLLTEREASNYGKVNLFKDILERRYELGKRTYITMNYQDGTNENLEQGLMQIGVRYGSRVYDRIFSMFNIIEFKGKSFRK